MPPSLPTNLLGKLQTTQTGHNPMCLRYWFRDQSSIASTGAAPCLVAQNVRFEGAQADLQSPRALSLPLRTNGHYQRRCLAIIIGRDACCLSATTKSSLSAGFCSFLAFFPALSERLRIFTPAAAVGKLAVLQTFLLGRLTDRLRRGFKLRRKGLPRQNHRTKNQVSHGLLPPISQLQLPCWRRSLLKDFYPPVFSYYSL